MVGRKDDAGKPPWHLLPWGAVEEVVRVLGFGAEKYAPGQWAHVPDAEQRYFAAALRHLVAHRQGELRDPESGRLHLAHAACSVLFLLALALRPRGGLAEAHVVRLTPPGNQISNAERGDGSGYENARPVDDPREDSGSQVPAPEVSASPASPGVVCATCMVYDGTPDRDLPATCPECRRTLRSGDGTRIAADLDEDDGLGCGAGRAR